MYLIICASFLDSARAVCLANVNNYLNFGSKLNYDKLLHVFVCIYICKSHLYV